MKKVLVVIFGIILSTLLVSISLAEEGDDSAIQSQTLEQGSDKDGKLLKSWVSQSKIDTVIKRKEAAARRDKKLLIRAKNVQSNENITDSSSLFRSSK